MRHSATLDPRDSLDRTTSMRKKLDSVYDAPNYRQVDFSKGKCSGNVLSQSAEGFSTIRRSSTYRNGRDANFDAEPIAAKLKNKKNRASNGLSSSTY